MKLFLTGSTGLLGSNLVPLLASRGHEVTIMVRKPDQAAVAFADVPGLTIVEGDLDAIEKVRPHLAGMDAVIHAAALFTEYYQKPVPWERFEKLNVEAAVTLLKMAKEAGVRKAVFISSVGALADPFDTLMDPAKTSDFYRRSKILGEQRIAAEPALKDFPIVILRPSFIFGPNDPAPTSAGKFAQEIVKTGKLMLFPGDAIPMVDARDVSLAAALSVESETARGAYNISGTEIPTLEAVKMIAANVSGAKISSVPVALGLFAGSLIDVKVRLFGGINPMPPEGIRFLSTRLHIDATRSIRELGMKYRPFEETARDVANYWIERVKRESGSAS